VHQSWTLNSTFSFNFTGTHLVPQENSFLGCTYLSHTPGDFLFLNTLTSSTNGELSLSINGGDPEIFDTTAPTASYALLNLNVTSLVKRSLERRNGSAVDVQNQCVGKLYLAQLQLMVLRMFNPFFLSGVVLPLLQVSAGFI
jgi:hypothetical protein